MNITIRNNSKALVELVVLNSGDLKELLSNMNYQVTSVNKPFEQLNETAEHSMMQTYLLQSTSTYTGVDIKV